MKKNIPVGVQLFAVRAEVSKSLPETLKSVAALGYKGAEPWGYDGSTLIWQKHPAKDIRKMYDDVGLKCCGFHVATDSLQPANLTRSVEFHQTLGNKFLIVAMDKVRMATTAGIHELAGILNSTAEALKPLGMYCGYHAHDFDAAVVDGWVGWEVLFENTRADVIMQLDVGNYASGGGDSVGILRKFSNRARSLHLKEFGGPAGAVIGEGKMDWPTIFQLVDDQQNTEWFVVEDCNADGSGYEVVGRSLQALKKMGVAK